MEPTRQNKSRSTGKQTNKGPTEETLQPSADSQRWRMPEARVPEPESQPGLGDPESPSGEGGRLSEGTRQPPAGPAAQTAPQKDQSREFSPPPLHAGIQEEERGSAPLQPVAWPALSARQLSSPGPRASRPRPLPTPVPRKRQAGHQVPPPPLWPRHHSQSPSAAASTDHRQRRRSGDAISAPAPAGAAIVLPPQLRGPGPGSPLQLARLLAEGSGLVVAGISEHLHAAVPAPGPSHSLPALCQGLGPAPAAAVSSLACPAHFEGRDWKAPTVHHSLSPGGAPPSRSHPGLLLPAVEVPGRPRRPPPSPVPACLPAWLFARLLWPGASPLRL